MTPTIEDVKRVADTVGALRFENYSETNFTDSQLQSFAQHYIEVGRKMQQKDNALDKQVSDGIYQDRVDDNLALCEALRAVYTICGEDKEVERIVHEVIAEHGIDDR